MTGSGGTGAQALKPGHRVQWLDMPGYALGTVQALTSTGVKVALDSGFTLDVGEFNVQHSLRRVRAADDQRLP